MENSQKIGWIKFWTPKDDWYYLDENGRDEYISSFNKIVEDAKKTGAELLGVYKCRGQSIWMRFEMWEFPNVDGVIDFTRKLEGIGHYQYFEEANTIGRKYERTGDKDNWVI